MGSVFGAIKEEMPKHDVLEKTDKFEVRQYGPVVVAETVYPGKMMEGKGNSDAFWALAGYIGVVSAPKNIKAGADQGTEAIPMTSPVIMQGGGESIAMTAPVIMEEKQQQDGDTQHQPSTVMQFVLPSKYSSLDTAPRPTDPRVTVREVSGKKVGVFTFNGSWSPKEVEQKATQLKEELQSAGHQTKGKYLVAFYNSPFTIPYFRRNEVWYELET